MTPYLLANNYSFSQNSKDKSPQNYIELKTSRIILTDRNKASFRRSASSSSSCVASSYTLLCYSVPIDIS